MMSSFSVSTIRLSLANWLPKDPGEVARVRTHRPASAVASFAPILIYDTSSGPTKAPFFWKTGQAVLSNPCCDIVFSQRRSLRVRSDSGDVDCRVRNAMVSYQAFPLLIRFLPPASGNRQFAFSFIVDIRSGADDVPGIDGPSASSSCWPTPFAGTALRWRA